MTQDLEREFQKAARKLVVKKRYSFARSVGSVLLLASGVIGGIGLMLNSGSFAGVAGSTGFSWLLFFGVCAAALALGILRFSARSRSASQGAPASVFPGGPTIGRVLERLRSIKRKYILGYALLLLAFVYRLNASLFTAPFGDLLTEWRYRPAPPTQSSPWPWNGQEELHPLISSLPPDANRSIRSVSAYIFQREPDPYLQVKALHDYVISHVSYDDDVLDKGIRPLQDAKTVFRTGRGVCEGYAKLFAALAQEIGLDVVVINGKIRRDLAPLDVIPAAFRVLSPNYDWTRHAWNAVKVNGQWQLVDTTWDDREADGFTPVYSGEYLMPAPKVMIVSHLPDQSAWQLIKGTKSPDAFEEQPILTPQFFRDNLRLISPKTYETKVGKRAIIEIELPPQYQKDFLADFVSTKKESLPSLLATSKNQPAWKQKLIPCSRLPGKEAICQLSCDFPAPGLYQVLLSSVESVASTARPRLISMGQLSFQAR